MDQPDLESIYRTMLRIRRFDEGVTALFQEGLVKGTAHSYVGQEAVAAGACAALSPADFVVSHHRGHGHCIAKGASLDRMMAELMGRVTGYCKGLGGSMHIAALELNILDVDHHRERASLDVDEVEVALTVETRGQEHRRNALRALRDRGWHVRPS